jgi:hypothetical protein
LAFDAIFISEINDIKVDFDFKDKASRELRGKAEARKSYRAFLYPTGAPADFPDGSLVKWNDNFYLVSNGKLRKFSDSSALEYFGLRKENFEEVSEDELGLNKAGREIKKGDPYPDDCLIKIGDDFYKFKNEKLEKFVSAKAFLSSFDSSQSVEKNPDFIDKYPLSENIIGFGDGTLLAFGESAYAVEDEKIFPIADASVFEALGWDWDDVIWASGEEIGMYEKGKIFDLKNPHPNGTVFKTTEESKYYLIQQREKREITSESVLKKYLKNNPVTVERESENAAAACELEREFEIFGSSLFCHLPVSELQNFVSNNYQFRVSFSEAVEADNLTLTAKRLVNWNNFKFALLEIKKKILANYVPQ